MYRILLVMEERLFAQSLKRNFEENGLFECFIENKYDNVNLSATMHKVDIVLIGIVLKYESLKDRTDNISYKLDNILNSIKDSNYKKMILCSGEDNKSRKLVVKLKKLGLIGDFIFYDSSLEYMKSKLRAIA